MARKAPSTKIGDVVAAYIAEMRHVVISERSLNTTSRPITRLVGSAIIRDQSDVADTAASYISARRGEGVSDATIRRELVTLRASLRRAWKLGHLTFVPFVTLPKYGAPRKRWLSPEEAKKLLEACAPQTDLFVRVALLTGARAGAIMDLTWDRIDLDRLTIDFRRTDLSRRAKGRAIVPMGADLAGRLRHTPDKKRDGRLFPVTLRSIQRDMREAASRAGLVGITPHVLRHTAATWMLGEHGLPLITASRMLGHSTSAITDQVYTHIIPPHLLAASKALESTLAGRMRPAMVLGDGDVLVALLREIRGSLLKGEQTPASIRRVIRMVDAVLLPIEFS